MVPGRALRPVLLVSAAEHVTARVFGRPWSAGTEQMDQNAVAKIVFELLIVLAMGLISGAICKRTGISMLAGYLLGGVVLGSAVLGPLYQKTHEMEYLAEAGVLLLLFSIGIEFSLADLLRMARPFLVGGTMQMMLVAVPTAVVAAMLQVPWRSAVLLGSAAAFSSTVLVFKALEEWGQATGPHGRRAIAILLYQDTAVVPMVLLAPLLAGQSRGPDLVAFGLLAAKSLGFLVAIPVGRWLTVRLLVPWLSRLRSVELLVLFTVSVLGSATLAAYYLGLPPMIGAFGAGLMLNGNRLTPQIDSVILPFRETFAAVFFVSLGTLIRFDALVASPLTCLAALVAVLVLKTSAATIALRVARLPWKSALGMGLGLAQIGEFAFVLLMVGLSQGIIEPEGYDLMMFIAVISLIVTPQLLKIGLRLAEQSSAVEHEIAIRPASSHDRIRRAAVIGVGPVGSQIASQLETIGYDVCLVDLSPLNLHPFAQQGFRTIVGDGSDRSVLRRADVPGCSLVAITMPADRSAIQAVSAVRRLNPTVTMLVRCRFQASASKLRGAGATYVFSDEAEVAGRFMAYLQHLSGNLETRASLGGDR